MKNLTENGNCYLVTATEHCNGLSSIYDMEHNDKRNFSNRLTNKCNPNMIQACENGSSLHW